jgi:GDP-L-fucose synthase
MFKDKKVLVAGGSGLIGIQLVDLLIQHGARVNVVDLRKPYGRLNFPDTVTFKKMDLTYYTNCISACKDIDYVFNLMCIKGSPKAMKEKPASHLVPMIRFNTNLMEAARECNVRRYLYTSSVGVYHPTEVLVEDDVWKTFPSENDWYAGWTKRIGELQAQAYEIEYGWDSISIVRPTNTYGPYDYFDSDSATVVPSLIKKILSGKSPIVVWGDGSNVRDFMYSRDVAKGMMLVMEKSPGSKYPVNLGSGKRYSIKDLVNVILDNVDKKPEIVWDTSKITGDNVRVMNIDRAKSLGFKQTISLEEGVRRTINWYRDER